MGIIAANGVNWSSVKDFIFFDSWRSDDIGGQGVRISWHMRHTKNLALLSMYKIRSQNVHF